jgi:CRP-like cAMP-binding protein
MTVEKLFILAHISRLTHGRIREERKVAPLSTEQERVVTMAIETNIELLGCVPLFEGLSYEQLTAIANKGKKAFFESRVPIIKNGQNGDVAYLILSGRVAAEAADSVSKAEHYEAGAFIAELSMIVETQHSVTIRAEERVRALAISRADLLEVMEADPSIARHFSDKLIARLTAFAKDLREVDARFAVLESSLDEAIAIAG